MKRTLLILIILTISLSGCKKNPCPEGSVSYISEVSEFPADQSEELILQSLELEINGKSVMVDRIIHGPLCNDTWDGTIYVACDVQVMKWKEKPNFLEKCNLRIEPDTVVYVAAHNNAPYYKGCSACH